MKTFKQSLKAGLILLLVAGFIGCSDFLDVNKNPNNPPTVSVEALMGNVTYYSGQNVYNLGSTTSYYVQYLASPNQASSTDIHERVSLDGTWAGIYGVMSDLTDLEQMAEEQGRPAYLAISKVLKALNLGMAIDAWGNLPYSEAFNAETLTPSYDDAETLYREEVIGLLDEAIAILEDGNFPGPPAADDFIHQGEMGEWLFTANALKARYLNHYSNTPEYDVAAVLSAVDNAYPSNAQEAVVTGFEDLSGKRNPWGQVAINNANLLLGGWLSEQIIQALDGTTYGVVDPRLEVYTDTTDAGTYRGTENGAGRGDAPEQGARSVLTVNTYFAQPTGPLEIITYSEIKFIEAEAALRDGQTTRAYQAYLDGIEAHMTKLGVEPSEQNAYLTDPAVAVGEGGLGLEDIFREKYKVMFLNPEAWVDARRYDYGYEDMTLPANHNPALGGEFILKIDYPDSEYGRNGSNVPDYGQPLLEPVFWDQ